MNRAGGVAALLGLWLLAGSAEATVFGSAYDVFKQAREATKEISLDQELRIGADMAATLLDVVPLVDDAGVQTYVNQVGQWVALHTERPDLPWRFGVLDTDTINAFHAPGGYVFITKGMLLALNDEAELAAVLSVEIAHVMHRHQLRAIKRDKRSGLFASLLKLASAAGEDEENQEAVEFLVDKSRSLYTEGLRAGDVHEADDTGVVLLTRSGYDPYALLDALTTFESIKDSDRVIDYYTDTHPDTEARIERLDRLIDGPLDRYAGGLRVRERFAEVFRDLAALPPRRPRGDAFQTAD